MRTIFTILFSLLFIPAAFAQTSGGLNQAEVIGPFLNGALPPRTPRPSTGSWKLVNAFPKLTFIDPVQMLPVPYSNRFLILEKNGRITVFENNKATTSKTVLLNVSSQVQSTHDSGMLGAVFHPDFGNPSSPNRHYLYVYYRYTTNKTQLDKAYCRLSRFTWDPSTNVIAPSSEFILINQFDQHNWHNGGGLLFGPDGFLYVSTGDEGGSNDQFKSSQKLNGGLLSGVLRIDVDKDATRSHPIRRQPLSPITPPSGWPASYSQGYYVPNDNPWQSPTGTQLEEFWAIGTRSPHRMTLDPLTGDIWLGDIGQNTQEEISKVVRGANLQWPYREGSVAGPKAKPSPLIGTDQPPVYAYGRSVGGCVIGGYVYRGSLHPELYGKYIFGDHNNGLIRSLDTSGSSPVVTTLTTLQRHGPGPKNGMSSFAVDASGEIYVLALAGTDLDGGIVYRLEKSTEGVPEPPTLLSQTGAFTNLQTMTAAPGLIPYGVIQPLWSDGAEKQRWIAIPNDGVPNSPSERIGWSEEGNWTFPIGTVLVKHFEVPGRRLETRFYLQGEGGDWFGFTYRWHPDGSDAELLPEAPLDENYTVTGVTRTWHFPGRNECNACHTDATGKALSVRTRQLNRDFFYSATGRTANQLVTLNRLGFFSPAIDESRLSQMLTLKAQDDSSATLERRARSYLDANCSHCHQPATPTPAEFDARLTTVPWLQGLIAEDAVDDLDITGAQLIKPGDVARSVVYHRLGSTVKNIAMPPIAKNVVDAAGMQLLSQWINSLDPTLAPGMSGMGNPTPGDHSPPSLTLSLPGGPSQSQSPFTATITANKPIVGLSLSDFTVQNATLSELSGSGASWTVKITPTQPGSGSIALASDRVIDASGNANLAVAPVSFNYQPQGLLSNAGFESGLNDWDYGPSVTTVPTAHGGTKAASLGTSTWLVTNISVEALKNYLFQGWIKPATANAHAEVGLTFWDANGVWIDDRILAVSPGTSWAPFQIAFTAPVSAMHVSVWAVTGASGGLLVDDMSVELGGSGEPRPTFTSSHVNLLNNGDFESGIPPWDTGGSVTLSATPRNGQKAARLGIESFVVQTKVTTPGQRIALAGYYQAQGITDRAEIGFSFWDASGNWITDRSIFIDPSNTYTPFLVDTSVPEGSATLTLWVYNPEKGQIDLDDLVFFYPDEQISNNLFSNGDFESGATNPWDTGGTNVQITSDAYAGSKAALLGADSFLVHNQAAISGDTYTLSGVYKITDGSSGEREAGFSFWGAQGQWLGDSITTLTPVGNFTPFTVAGEVPAGTASLSAWIWTGVNSGRLVVDTLSLTRSAPVNGNLALLAGAPAESPEAAPTMLMALKSNRTIDLGDLSSQPSIQSAFGVSSPVLDSAGWRSKSGRITETTGPSPKGTKTLATTINGRGIVAVRYSFTGAARSAALVLLIDGVENGRVLVDGSSDWRTLSASISSDGPHAVELRLVGEGTAKAADLSKVRVSLGDFRFVPGSPHFQPDLAIAVRGKRLIGVNIFNKTTARQQAQITMSRRNSAMFRMSLRNASSANRDSAHITGPVTLRGYRVSYTQLGAKKTNVTAAVAARRHETPVQNPRAAGLYDIQVTRTTKRSPRAFSGIIRANSVLDGRRADAVRVSGK